MKYERPTKRHWLDRKNEKTKKVTDGVSVLIYRKTGKAL